MSRGFVHVALHEEALKGIAMTLKDFGEVVDGFRVEADVQGGNMATKEKLYVGLELGDNFGLRAWGVTLSNGQHTLLPVEVIVGPAHALATEGDDG